MTAALIGSAAIVLGILVHRWWIVAVAAVAGGAVTIIAMPTTDSPVLFVAALATAGAAAGVLVQRGFRSNTARNAAGR